MGKTKRAQLSQSEAEVVWHIAAGFDRHQTAAFRGCSAESVDTHRANALRKLGLRNNVDLARLALRQGWITLDLQEGEPAANLDAVPGAVVLPELGRAPTPLDVEQAAHAATKEELRIALEALASSRGPCHPGDRCSHWPECEICGPPRM